MSQKNCPATHDETYLPALFSPKCFIRNGFYLCVNVKGLQPQLLSNSNPHFPFIFMPIPPQFGALAHILPPPPPFPFIHSTKTLLLFEELVSEFAHFWGGCGLTARNYWKGGKKYVGMGWRLAVKEKQTIGPRTEFGQLEMWGNGRNGKGRDEANGKQHKLLKPHKFLTELCSRNRLLCNLQKSFRFENNFFEIIELSQIILLDDSYVPSANKL
jgi:hypothetical protein